MVELMLQLGYWIVIPLFVIAFPSRFFYEPEEWSGWLGVMRSAVFYILTTYLMVGIAIMAAHSMWRPSP